MKYSVIIPTFNAEKTIEYCLNSVKSFYNENTMEVIICDNQSNDNTLKIAEKFPFKIIHNNKKQSASSTRNLGAMSSTYDNLIFIDSDCVAPKNIITILENTPNFNDSKCIAGNFSSKNIYKNFFSLYKTSYTHLKLKNKKMNVSNAAIMFIKKKYFLEVGMYDENIITMEDDEFSIRFQAKGYTTVFNPNLEVDHYKKYDFVSLTKNDFSRAKQLVTILNINLRNNHVKECSNWIGLYLRGLINCLLIMLNIIVLSNIIFNYVPSFGGHSNFEFFILINLIYLLNNIDIFWFNLRTYGLIFSLMSLFFQIFTFLTIILALFSGFVELIFKKLSKTS